MRRRGIVVGSCNPLADWRNKFGSFRRRSGGRRELICGLVQRDIVQPDDVSIVFSELSVVVIVRPNVVWLKVSVRRRLRMVGVGLVDVFGRQRRRKGDVGCQYQADDDPAKGRRHAGEIMVFDGTRRQTRRLQVQRMPRIASRGRDAPKMRGARP